MAKLRWTYRPRVNISPNAPTITFTKLTTADMQYLLGWLERAERNMIWYQHFSIEIGSGCGGDNPRPFVWHVVVNILGMGIDRERDNIALNAMLYDIRSWPDAEEEDY